MTDINLLFSRDPKQMTDTDRQLIIEEMRKKRQHFEAGVKPAPKAKKAKPTPAELKGLDLDIKL